MAIVLIDGDHEVLERSGRAEHTVFVDSGWNRRIHTHWYMTQAIALKVGVPFTASNMESNVLVVATVFKVATYTVRVLATRRAFS